MQFVATNPPGVANPRRWRGKRVTRGCCGIPTRKEGKRRRGETSEEFETRKRWIDRLLAVDVGCWLLAGAVWLARPAWLVSSGSGSPSPSRTSTDSNNSSAWIPLRNNTKTE
jgi:hypothetical protein